ncbi:transposase family protein [Spinactinospora alkalitolerans]
MRSFALRSLLSSDAVLPHLAGLRIDDVVRSGLSIRTAVTTRVPEALCPVCESPSRRVHSRYGRRLADPPVSGQEVLIHLGVRQFFCE